MNFFKKEDLTITPADEIYWAKIRKEFSVASHFINLENGYFSTQPVPVLEAFERYNRLVSAETAYFFRRDYPNHLNRILKLLAEFAGVGEEELLLTRNATEAMNILIQGYPFNAGDEVVLGDHDYHAIVATFEMLQKRQQVTLKPVRLPLHPKDDDQITSLYEAAMTPKTRVLLLTHMINTTGHLLPVAKIAQMARQRGVDVLIDAAHSFAQVQYHFPDFGGDFIAVNLHKWLGAPLGAGLLYIRKNRIGDIKPLFGDVDYPTTDIRKLGHFGTTPPGPVLAVEDALAFHQRIGSANKEARLRYLKDYWVDRVKELPSIELLTPSAANRSCAIAAFRIKGKPCDEVVNYLFDEHRIFTVTRKIDGGEGVRVTPHLYTTTNELDQLIAALSQFQRGA